MTYRTTPPPLDGRPDALIAWAVAESLAWPAETPYGVYNWWLRHARALRRSPAAIKAAFARAIKVGESDWAGTLFEVKE